MIRYVFLCHIIEFPSLYDPDVFKSHSAEWNLVADDEFQDLVGRKWRLLMKRFLIENHLKCAKQIKQIILFSFMKIKVLEGWVTRGVEDMVTERDYYLI